jgi:outer membrane protein insertion porin family
MKTTAFILLILFSPEILILAQNLEVKKIEFINVRNFARGQLEELLHSEEGDDFDTRLVKLDKILLTNFYRKQGFLIVEVMDSLIIEKKSGKVDIYYIINEGSRYYLGEFRFSGNNDISTKNLSAVFSDLRISSPFDEALINDGKRRIEDLYYNRGKPFVEIALDYEFKQDSLVVVKFNIKENQTIYIHDIEYIGLKYVQQFIIRRELDFKKGDLYSRKKLSSSQQNIYSTGLFDFVRFDITPLKNDSSRAILNILVQEKDPRWIGLRLGFAYEQEQSYGNRIELTAEGGHRNLFGTARSISLQLGPSFWYDFETHKIAIPENRIVFNFVEPWIGYTRTPGLFQTSYRQLRPINSADFDVISTSFQVSHKFSDYRDVSGSIGLKLVDVLSEGALDTTLESDIGKDQIYWVSLYGKRDSKNNFFHPTNGSFIDLSISFSYTIGEFSEGKRTEQQYFTIISSWQRYQPMRVKLFNLRPKITLATRLKGGAIFEVGDTEDLPISELFFAGGATTVRGYEEQLLGPTRLDENGIKTGARGGKLLLLMNAELRIPLFWLFVGELFIDGGNVWRNKSDFNPKEIKFTTGLGIALLTPLGPVRVDYGYKLMKEASDRKNDAFHLGFYFAF